MDLQTRIATTIEQPLLAMGYLLVRVRFGGGNRPVLQIMAERPDGTMTVEDCADVSRAMSALLDVEDLIGGPYALEISSPGLDRPLMKPDDFRRFAGYEAKLETALPIDGRKRWRGQILGWDEAGGCVRLLTEDRGEVALVFERVVEARLVLTDELIAASLKGGLLPPAQIEGVEPPPIRQSDDCSPEGRNDHGDGDEPDSAAPGADA